MRFSKVLITGATSLLGKEIARRFARKSISLMLVGRDEDALKSLEESLSGNILIYTGDLTNRAFLDNLLQQIQSEVPDLIINSAGKGLYGKTILHPNEEHLSMLKLNCEALLDITITGAKALINAKKKGIILNISSVASFFPFPYFNTYAATKAFVRYFSVAFDREIKAHGVRILCACPGRIATDFSRKAAKGHEKLSTFGQMSVEKACDFLFKQIRREKILYTFNLRYKMLVAFLRILPSALREALLGRSIQKSLNIHKSSSCSTSSKTNF